MLLADLQFATQLQLTIWRARVWQKTRYDDMPKRVYYFFAVDCGV
jgi:hypothetical protein